MNPGSSEEKNTSRILAVVIAPLVVVGLLALVFAIFALQRPTPVGAEKTVAQEDVTSPLPPVTQRDGNNPVIDASNEFPEVPPEEIVALVNQQVIPEETLRVAQAADRAMTALLGGTPVEGPEILEMVINGELVWQAAIRAGFQIAEEDVWASLEGLLSGYEKSEEEFADVLRAEGLTTEEFQAYFSRLLVIDRFSRQQAQELGITVETYLRRLQDGAQISFGPAASRTAGSEGTSRDAPGGITLGQRAYAFQLPALNLPEADFLTLEDLLGKPVVLSFWATWCPYCRAQTPVLVEAHARFGDQVQFVGINVREEQPTVQAYVSAHQMVFPTLLDVSGKVAAQYRVVGFPTTFFLDAQGRIVGRQIGQLAPEQVEQHINRLLSSEK